MAATADPALAVAIADPQGAEALALLREAAVEARALYPELNPPDAPWPTNGPTPPRGVYALARFGGRVVGMGAHRPLDATTTELRRMYVLREARRSGVASALLRFLEAHAVSQGFGVLRLETGHRQQPAVALYLRHGFAPIPPFGPYAGDPTSLCFEKRLRAAPGAPPERTPE